MTFRMASPITVDELIRAAGQTRPRPNGFGWDGVALRADALIKPLIGIVVTGIEVCISETHTGIQGIRL